MILKAVSIVAAFVISASGPLTAATADEPVEAARPIISTEAELNSVIARLANEETRLAAIERLYKTSRSRVYLGGSMMFESDPLAQKAYDAARPYCNLRIAEEAMRSESATLRVWGLNLLSNADEDTLKSWRYLVPLVRELAIDPSVDVRSNAQRVLRDQPDQQDFLARLVETETYADLVMRLIGGGPGLDWRMNLELLRLLNHPDEEVRRSAMNNVGFNSHRAEVWQFDASDAVVDRIFELAHSPIESDRAGAAFALRDLHARYPDRVRQAMLELANDPSAKVRSSIAAALKDDRDRPEVHEVLEKLVHDEAVSVRYFAITSIGAADHVDELRSIEAGDDRRYARWAEQKLKQLGVSP